MPADHSASPEREGWCHRGWTWEAPGQTPATPDGESLTGTLLLLGSRVLEEKQTGTRSPAPVLIDWGSWTRGQQRHPLPPDVRGHWHQGHCPEPSCVPLCP